MHHDRVNTLFTRIGRVYPSRCSNVEDILFTRIGRVYPSRRSNVETIMRPLLPPMASGNGNDLLSSHRRLRLSLSHCCVKLIDEVRLRYAFKGGWRGWMTCKTLQCCIIWMISLETNVGFPAISTNGHDFGTVYILT